MEASQLLAALIEQTLEPALDQIQRALGRPPALLVRLYSQGVPGLTASMGGALGASQEPADGEVRVEIKPSSVEGRSLFVAEVVLAKNPALRGYSGFVLNGDVRGEEGQIIFRTRSRTNRHNVWDWKTVRGSRE